MRTNQKAGAYNQCCIGVEEGRCGQRATGRFPVHEWAKKLIYGREHPLDWHYRCANHLPPAGVKMELVPYPDQQPPPPEATWPLPDIIRRVRRLLN